MATRNYAQKYTLTAASGQSSGLIVAKLLSECSSCAAQACAAAKRQARRHIYASQRGFSLSANRMCELPSTCRTIGVQVDWRHRGAQVDAPKMQVSLEAKDLPACRQLVGAKSPNRSCRFCVHFSQRSTAPSELDFCTDLPAPLTWISGASLSACFIQCEFSSPNFFLPV